MSARTFAVPAATVDALRAGPGPVADALDALQAAGWLTPGEDGRSFLVHTEAGLVDVDADEESW